MSVRRRLILLNIIPWPSGSAGWSIVPYTKRLLVRFLVRIHTRLRVQSPVTACMRGNQSMFLSLISISLSFFLPLSLKSIYTYPRMRIKKTFFLNKYNPWTRSTALKLLLTHNWMYNHEEWNRGYFTHWLKIRILWL